MRQILLDTETTGLSFQQGDRIVEIGCVEMVNRRLTGNRYHQYINPERAVGEEAVQVHGLTNEFLNDQPTFHEIAEDFYQFVEGAELIAHNAPFDINFLEFELGLSNPDWKKLSEACEIFDTLILARKLHPGQRNSLDALTKRYKIDNFNRELHGALLDAEILAQVYLVMTGGQSGLFDEVNDQSITSQSHKKTKRTLRTQGALPVIKSTDEEILQHEKFLELIKQAADGKCLWTDK